MEKSVPNPDAIATVAVQPDLQGSGKDAWATPVVREYEPSKVTEAGIVPGAIDIGIYS